MFFAAAVGLVGCELLTGEDGPGEVIDFVQGVSIMPGDSTWEVDGEPIPAVFSSRSAVLFEHVLVLRHGQDLGREWESRYEHWVATVSSEHVTERNDTVFRHYLDFGAVTLAGDTLQAHTWTPRATRSDTLTVQVVDPVLYRRWLFERIRTVEGTDSLVTSVPYLDDLTAGDPIVMAAMGGERAGAFDTTMTVTSFPPLMRMENDGAIDLPFRHEVPVVNARRPLVLEYSSALDPEGTVFVLRPVWPLPRATNASQAVGRISSRASVVVVPPDVLTNVLVPLDAVEAIFRLEVRRSYRESDAVRFQNHLTNSPASLAVLHREHFGVLIRLVR